MTTTLAAVVLSTLLVHPVAATTAGEHDADGRNPDSWRDVLERAVEASRASAYEGRLMIVAFDEGGPTVAEVDVAHGRDDGMRVGRAEAWVVGRDADTAFYWQPEAGTLLSLGSVERTELSIPDVLAKYTVREHGVTELATGNATVLAIRERDADHDRERLYVDEATGLVVRRETYTDTGDPRRLVAFTALEVTDLSVEAPTGLTAQQQGETRVISERGMRILPDVGWMVPEELPGGFGLRSGYARPDDGGRSLHLVYSDGLYTLSVYQQHGRVNLDALAGAVVVGDDGMHIWRWPGSEPERMVWTGADLTFTAVSDAPTDEVLRAVTAFPADPPPAMPHRIWRGLKRVGTWLWPFG